MKMLKTAGDPSDDIISGDDTKVKSGSAAFWLIVPFFIGISHAFVGVFYRKRYAKRMPFPDHEL